MVTGLPRFSSELNGPEHGGDPARTIARFLSEMKVTKPEARV